MKQIKALENFQRLVLILYKFLLVVMFFKVDICINKMTLHISTHV